MFSEVDGGFPVQEISKEEKHALKVENILSEETAPIIKTDQGRTNDGEGKSTKPRPNYFVAIQVDNSEIHQSLQDVQDSLLEHKPLLKRALVPLSTLHITFIVMHVDQKEDLNRAKNALAASYENVKEDLKESPLILTFLGLSNFRKQVLFAELKMDENYGRMLSLYEKIASCFESCGFNVREENKFTPHLTVAKLSRDPRLRKKGLRQISPDWYADFAYNKFGEQRVKSLQLLRMQGSENGYYHCDEELFFDLRSFEPEVPLEKKLLSSLEKKKEVRKNIRDLTSKKLGLNERS